MTNKAAFEILLRNLFDISVVRFLYENRHTIHDCVCCNKGLTLITGLRFPLRLPVWFRIVGELALVGSVIADNVDVRLTAIA